MKTLEKEFEEFKALHKYSILKAKLTDYFITKEMGEVNVPNFQRRGQLPEDKAEREIKQLILRQDGLKEFNRLYEIAYKELAEACEI